MLKDFLDNHFYRTGIFSEKMRLYCEFRDTYGDNLELISSLDHKIQDSKYKMYYEYYGTQGCRAVSYKEADLYKRWKDVTKEEVLSDIIFKKFRSGDRYPMTFIKKALREIYKILGITKTAKATDLGKYFKLSKTRITLPDKTVVNGFKLESL